MSEPLRERIKKEGIDIDEVTFDADGRVQGVEDSELDDVAGGVMAVEDNSGCVNGLKCN